LVGHSYGAVTAPQVADRLRADALVLLTGIIPYPGEAPAAWWATRAMRHHQLGLPDEPMVRTDVVVSAGITEGRLTQLEVGMSSGPDRPLRKLQP
jgi:hypothetical protein